MNKNTTIANVATMGGVTLALMIAHLPLSFSLAILAFTGVGCGYLTIKEEE